MKPKEPDCTREIEHRNQRVAIDEEVLARRHVPTALQGSSAQETGVTNVVQEQIV